jgi:hypothetical protein
VRSLLRTVCWGAAIAVALPAYGQSLGDIARQEESRRASVKTAVKTLSNADLRPSEIAAQPGSAPAESCYMSKSQGRCVSAEELVSVSNADIQSRAIAPKEGSWRQNADSIRLQLETARRRVVSLEGAAANEGRSPGEREVMQKALVTARQSIAAAEERWEDFERSATTLHIPRAWLEPIPTLTTRNPQ